MLISFPGLAVSSEVVDQFNSEKSSFDLVLLADDLDHPWGMAFLPDDRLIITERDGRLKLYEKGKVKSISLSGFPEIHNKGQGGLLDVTPHPNFTNTGLIYFTYSHVLPRGSTTALARANLQQDQLTEIETLFIAKTDSTTSHHYGSRIRFDNNGLIYMTIGDRGQRHTAQRLDLHAGKVLRLTDNGKPASGNPFINTAGALPEIYSYGHRNPQGLSRHPETGEMWLSEHGPRGGDEINLIKPGVNYGWPIITYGKEYIGGSIGEGTHHPDMAQPIYQWTPSIAPSGIFFYSGKAFPSWQGNLFTTALKYELLVRHELINNKIVHEERLIEEEVGRIRAVTQGTDDLIYLLTDEYDGALYRLQPK
ncbi:PQQ-dependent sugar dehydrogenase [Kiloniella sp.]|uniref:PQQ-dependent sugar dehydrogenase n=1 Tax=Kiloniella sp. TaxID=1938587 RepID=UPI003B028AA3